MKNWTKRIDEVIEELEPERVFSLRRWIDDNYRMIMLGCMVAELLMIGYLCVK